MDRTGGAPDRKAAGAYYTAAPLARALVAWAIEHGDNSVLDPAAGDGVFMAAAAERLTRLGATRPQVIGVELRPDAAAAARESLSGFGVPPESVHSADFLALEPGSLPLVDVVVGNPPFVRYQRLSRDQRSLAGRRSAAAGVALDALAGSWAGFVVHAGAFLRPGGRLAMVLPSEIGHARYAREVIAFLRNRFGAVRFVLFEAPLFPKLDQGVVLLLASGYGRPNHSFEVATVSSAADLTGLAREGLGALRFTAVDADALVAGRGRLHHAWLDPRARELLAWLKSSRQVSRLGQHARVMIGYVSAANDYFHLAPYEAVELDLGAVHLRRALFRSRGLVGLEFTAEDWAAAAENGEAGLLFAPADDLDPAVAAYLQHGEALGLPGRAKAKQRTPWWRVTRTAAPDLILTAMINDRPRLSVNAVQIAVSNTLHGVWRRSGSGAASSASLAAAASSSLTRLSAELEGRPLGGGLLKLEPSAAQALLLPLPATANAAVEPVVWRAIDRRLRAGDTLGAAQAADAAYLSGIPGVGMDDVELLSAAADRMRRVRRGN
ncbi:MAG TPA: N-6 DNA methylase [Trueperaceae bacterium]|nr:N-6 DNA methylase [Trueperaceae bacterium]